MRAFPTALPGVLLLELRVHEDERGWFAESWQRERYAALGVPSEFVQDNLAQSGRGVLRGLHLQHPGGQGKLVQALEGEIFDVAVDVRVGSPTFGRHVGVTLSVANHRQLWIPAGFAHGYCVVGERALISYKCSTPYRPDAELGVRFDDPAIAIPWPVTSPVVSAKDRAFPRLKDIDPARLPRSSADAASARP